MKNNKLGFAKQKKKAFSNGSVFCVRVNPSLSLSRFFDTTSTYNVDLILWQIVCFLQLSKRRFYWNKLSISRDSPEIDLSRTIKREQSYQSILFIDKKQSLFRILVLYIHLKNTLLKYYECDLVYIRKLGFLFLHTENISKVQTTKRMLDLRNNMIRDRCKKIKKRKVLPRFWKLSKWFKFYQNYNKNKNITTENCGRKCINHTKSMQTGYNRKQNLFEKRKGETNLSLFWSNFLAENALGLNKHVFFSFVWNLNSFIFEDWGQFEKQSFGKR